MFNEITMCLICGSLDLKWSRSAVMFRYSRHRTLWAVAGASWRRKVTSLSSQGFWLCTNAWWDCFAVQWNKLHFWCVTAKSFMSDFLRLGTLTHNRATWENADSKARELFIIIVCMRWKLYCLNACYRYLQSSNMHMFHFFLTLNFFKDVEGNQKRDESGDCQAICLKFIVVLQLSRFYDHDTILSAF